MSKKQKGLFNHLRLIVAGGKKKKQFQGETNYKTESRQSTLKRGRGVDSHSIGWGGSDLTCGKEKKKRGIGAGTIVPGSYGAGTGGGEVYNPGITKDSSPLARRPAKKNSRKSAKKRWNPEPTKRETVRCLLTGTGMAGTGKKKESKTWQGACMGSKV